MYMRKERQSVRETKGGVFFMAGTTVTTLVRTRSLLGLIINLVYFTICLGIFFLSPWPRDFYASMVICLMQLLP